MLNVALVSMPYTILSMPSLGIAQLQAVVRQSLSGAVKLDSAYCYIDFAEYVGGVAQYDALGKYSEKALVEWMFSGAAFETEDTLEAYGKYFFEDGDFPRKRKLFELALQKRRSIGAFMDGLIERYRLAEYQVVGFTSLMSQNVASFAMARRLKALNPEVITCFGGANAEHPMGKTIAENVTQIDYVFSGEALISFPSFLSALLESDSNAIASLRGVHVRSSARLRTVSGGRPRSMLANIPVAVENVSGGCGTDELERNSGQAFNLNELPMLDYSEYLARIDRSPIKETIADGLVLPFQTSTGCWWADKVPCSFCGLTPHAFRQMSSAKARDYIAELIDKYQRKFRVFEATDPCMPVEYPRDVFAHVNQDKAALLQYEVKARMPAEDLAMMARANVLLPQPGIEALSTRTLKIMRKGVTAFHNVKFLKDCTEQGLYPIWNYLYGFPNTDYDELDTDKLIEDTRILSHMPPPSSFIPIEFQRYSEYFNERARYGLKLRPMPQYSYLYPFGEAVIAEMAYFFRDDEYSRKMSTKYQSRIRAINLSIVEWMIKFRAAIPKLHFIKSLVIEDTRFQRRLEHRVSPLEREALTFLNEPRTPQELRARFELSLESAERLLRKFVDMRMLFSERGKHMSVVCARCSLTREIYKGYLDFVKGTASAFD